MEEDTQAPGTRQARAAAEGSGVCGGFAVVKSTFHFLKSSRFYKEVAKLIQTVLTHLHLGFPNC